MGIDQTQLGMHLFETCLCQYFPKDIHCLLSCRNVESPFKSLRQDAQDPCMKQIFRNDVNFVYDSEMPLLLQMLGIVYRMSL